MDRRAFVGTVVGGLLAAPLAAEAVPADRSKDRRCWRGVPEARKEGLRRPGWVEGQNIVVECTNGDESGARDLVRSPQVEVILASNNPSIAAAKAATTTIPIVLVYGDATRSAAWASPTS
jgi:hypothetical protein